MFRRPSEPISHQRVRDLLSSYLDSQVSQRERERIEGHLASCAACRRYQEELRATVQAVRGLPQVAPPRSFTLAQAPQRRTAWASPGWGAPLATATAAALFALLMLGEVAGLIGSPVARPVARPTTDVLSEGGRVNSGAAPQAVPQPTPTVGVPLGIMGVQGGTPTPAKQAPTPEPTKTPLPAPTPTAVPPPPPAEAAQPPLQVPLLPWLQGALGLLAVTSGVWWLWRRRRVRG